MSSVLDSEEGTNPEGRSRTGDFVFSWGVGLILFVGLSIVTGLSLFAAIGVGVVFGAVLSLRFFALRDEPEVQASVNVSVEQLEAFKRLRDVVAALPQPVVLLEPDGTIGMFNNAAGELFGGDITGRPLPSIVRSPVAQEVLRTVAATGAAAESEISIFGAEEKTLLFYAAPLEGGSGKERLLIMIRDRTAQRRLERMRTDFVANASHELRTPLTSVIGFIETLQGHAKDDPVAHERFLAVMAAQAERMLKLVEDLMDLSAIELTQAKPPDDTVSLQDIAKVELERLAPIAEKAGGTMTLADPPPDLSPIEGDRTQLSQIVANLCSNALKYGTSKDGSSPNVSVQVGMGLPPTMDNAEATGETPLQVAVRAGVTVEELIWLRVQDSGEGIERADLPRLTERFYRVNPEHSRAKGGTGLGLAIVKHILQRHRAGLRVESIIGEGSAFTCLFPPPR